MSVEAMAPKTERCSQPGRVGERTREPQAAGQTQGYAGMLEVVSVRAVTFLWALNLLAALSRGYGNGALRVGVRVPFQSSRFGV